MTIPPVLDDQMLEGMLTAAAAEPAARNMDLTEAIRREGWESVVLETPDWIIRFPRREDIAFTTELAVLAHVQGRLPVETPDVAWTGDSVRCMAYRKIIGSSFDSERWRSGTSAQGRVLTGSLADLLVAWREAFTPHDIGRLGIAPMGGAPCLEQLTSALSVFPPAVRPSIERLLALYGELFTKELAASGAVVLHGDFHLGNMVLDGPCGPVTGLWDFSCVATGAPSWDLHYLAGELSPPYADPEPAGTGSHLDLLGGVVARLRDQGISVNDLLLSDLMLSAEWIGDHEPAEASRWHRWLTSITSENGGADARTTRTSSVAS